MPSSMGSIEAPPHEAITSLAHAAGRELLQGLHCVSGKSLPEYRPTQLVLGYIRWLYSPLTFKIEA